MSTQPTPGERFEGIAQVLILLSIGTVSAAASFTHIHDWTMVNSPEGTGDWFGWANAVVSDLVPLGVGLEVRRRRRHHLPIGAYPITIILAAAALSVAGQLAQAKPSITGWLLAAVPAIGFLALTKLVISRPNAAVPVAPAPAQVESFVRVQPQPTAMAAPDHELIPGARIIADAHLRATGRPITLDALAERLRVPLATAERLYAALTAAEPHRPDMVVNPNGATAVDALT